MAKTAKRLLLVFLGSMVLCTLCLAQPAPDQVEFASVELAFLDYGQMALPALERLSDRDLQKFTGQGFAPPEPQLEQPVGAIKLWDEWCRPPAPERPASVGQNQVILSGPQK